MSNSQIPNQFSWSELMTGDPKQACEFYGSHFGWRFDEMDMGGEDYHIAKNNDVQIGGIMNKPAEVPTPVWRQYVTVTDIHATAQKITSLGGNLITPPTPIPGIGSFIVLQDPQGAVLSAIQYAAQE